MSERTRPEMRVEDLPAPAKELTPAEAEAAKGGILPYLEQSNTQQPCQITDGTSNTITAADGSVHFVTQSLSPS